MGQLEVNGIVWAGFNLQITFAPRSLSSSLNSRIAKACFSQWKCSLNCYCVIYTVIPTAYANYMTKLKAKLWWSTLCPAWGQLSGTATPNITGVGKFITPWRWWESVNVLHNNVTYHCSYSCFHFANKKVGCRQEKLRSLSFCVPPKRCSHCCFSLNTKYIISCFLIPQIIH